MVNKFKMYISRFNWKWYFTSTLFMPLVAFFTSDPFILLLTNAAVLFFVLFRIAIKEEGFFRMASIDSLTMLPNRHALERDLKERIRNRERFVVVFLDLDGFKEVNDSEGHAAGDGILIEIASEFMTKFKDYSSYRFGGDEFVFLNIDNMEAEKLANDIIRNIDRNYFINGNTYHVSASAGIAVYPKDGTTAEILMKKADHAMYKAKSSGKNQVKRWKSA